MNLFHIWDALHGKLFMVEQVDGAECKVLLSGGWLRSKRGCRTFERRDGIYVGQGRFVHAPSAGGTVRLDHITTPYWAAKFTEARRITSQ